MNVPPTIPPCPNRPFDELRAGERINFATSFTADDVDKFAAVSGDWNPLHVDEAYATQTPFRRRVAHGMLVASLLSRVAGMYFPGRQSLLLSAEHITFHNAVFVD